jgi:5-methylcytosine-specific restriction endonuclease McrA
MNHDLLAIASVAALVLSVTAAIWLRPARRRTTAAVGLCGLAVVAMVSALASREPVLEEHQIQLRPKRVASEGYVSSSTCRACHPREYATWHDSFHRTMTQVAHPGSVLGDFDGVTLHRFGKTWRLERRGDEFWIELDDPLPGSTGGRVWRKVTLTTGSHNMQLCWYESGHTRVMGFLPFVWLVSDQRWIPRASAFVLPPTDKMENEFGAWSIVCIKCHATHGRPRVDMDTSGLHGADTEVAEFGIACEACHGPAHDHVAANRNPLRRYTQHLSDVPDPTIVNPARLAHDRATEVCGQCHGNFDYAFSVESMNYWFQHGFEYRPGQELAKTKTLHAPNDEQFWPDGVPRVAGREYNSIVASACYQKGALSCLTCHVLHQPDDDPRPRREWANDQLRVIDEDGICLQCHESYGKDIQAHTHHKVESSGSRCFNCHMPHSSYGLLKGIRDHRIANPDARSSVEAGRPNACSQCHLDKTLRWVSDSLHEWYGTRQPNMTADEATIAAGPLWALKGDAAQRALVAWNLGWPEMQATAGADWVVPYLAELLLDPYEAVRVIAQRSLRRLPGYEDLNQDVIGAPEERTRQKREALDRWNKRQVPPGAQPREPVLIGPDGRLREEQFQRLLRLRDNRPVSLFE